MIHPAYVVLWIKGQQGLLCLLCHRISYNPTDITERYCGACHVWLEDVAEDYRPLAPPVERIVSPLFSGPPEEDPRP